MNQKIISSTASMTKMLIFIGTSFIFYFVLSSMYPNLMNHYLFWVFKDKHVILLLISIWLFSSFIIIKETQQGHLSIFGKRQNSVLLEGYHWLPPFHSIEISEIKISTFQSVDQEIHSANQISFMLSWNLSWTINNLNLHSNLTKDFLPNAFIGLVNDKVRRWLNRENITDIKIMKIDSDIIENIRTDINSDCVKWGVSVNNIFITKMIPKDNEVQQLYNSNLSLESIIDKVYTNSLGIDKKDLIKLIQIERGKMNSYDYNLSLDQQVAKIISELLKNKI